MKTLCAFFRTANLLRGVVLLATVCAASSVGAASVTFAWDANTEADLAGYKLYYGPTSGGYTTNIPLGKVTTYTIPNLVNGATYFFALTAVNSNAVESPYSTELRFPPPSNLPPTIAPIADVSVNEDAP